MSGCSIAQNWEPVVIRKKAPTAVVRKDEKIINVAHCSGAEIEILRRSIRCRKGFLVPEA